MTAPAVLAPAVLVLQHSDSAPAGLIGERIAAAGARQELRRPLAGDPLPASAVEAYDGLLVLGGPMAAYDDARHPELAAELRLIRDFVAAGRPVLGICLGAQLLARASGAAVWRHPTPEMGFTGITLTPAGEDDPLLGGLAPLPPLMQHHYDTFALPEGATLLATGPVCANQAFRLGPGQYALQFHLEVTPAIIRDWVDNHRGGGLPLPEGLATIDAQIARHMAAAAAFGRTVGDRWTAMLCRCRARAAYGSCGSGPRH